MSVCTLAIGEERLDVVGVPVNTLGVATRDAAGDEGGVRGAGLQGPGTLGGGTSTSLGGCGYRIASDPGKLHWGGGVKGIEKIWVG